MDPHDSDLEDCMVSAHVPHRDGSVGENSNTEEDTSDPDHEAEGDSDHEATNEMLRRLQNAGVPGLAGLGLSSNSIAMALANASAVAAAAAAAAAANAASPCASDGAGTATGISSHDGDPSSEPERHRDSSDRHEEMDSELHGSCSDKEELHSSDQNGERKCSPAYLQRGSTSPPMPPQIHLPSITAHRPAPPGGGGGGGPGSSPGPSNAPTPTTPPGLFPPPYAYPHPPHSSHPSMPSHLVPTSSSSSVGFQAPTTTHPGQRQSASADSANSDSSNGSNGTNVSNGTNGSQQGWSFEEQFKQLYEISDEPKRKEFLDDLFIFMQKRGSPINRLPIMAKSVLDLFELYKLVVARGGLVDVINKKLWQEIIKGLHLPSSITSAAFTLRTQYMKYLYLYECDRLGLSTPAELQAAIDGNRREGRRSSYGTYTDMVQRPPSLSASPSGGHASGMHNGLQISPMSLVTASGGRIVNGNGHYGGHHGGVQHPGAHHQMLPHHGGDPASAMSPAEFEARMMDYVKLFNKELQKPGEYSPHQPPKMNSSPPGSPREGGLNMPGCSSMPNMSTTDLSRLTLWNLYNTNASNALAQGLGPALGPSQISALGGSLGQLGLLGVNSLSSHEPNSEGDAEPQREALNLGVTRQQQQHAMAAAAIRAHRERERAERDREREREGERSRERERDGVAIKREPEDAQNNAQKRLRRLDAEDEREAGEPSQSQATSPTQIDLHMASAHIKINSAPSSADGKSGSQEKITVSMDINGIMYQGVLTARPTSKSNRMT